MSGVLEQLLKRHIAAGTMPGAVATIGPDCAPVAAGTMAIEGPAMPVDAVFRIQSMTKIITTVAALRLVEQGLLRIDDPVDTWLPELADRRVLSHPGAELHDTVPASRPITLHHLLTNQSGYGAIFTNTGTPLHRAMIDNHTEASGEPVALGAQEWLEALAELPLAFQPGEGWRYHHSFGLLGILLGRLTGQSTGEYLAEAIFDPLGMPDTGFAVPEQKLGRLPAAYRHREDGLEQMEPAGGGFYAAPPYDVSHAELVSTVADFHTFLRALLDGRLIGAEHLSRLSTDQVPSSAKTPDSFFPGFWDAAGWGYGVTVVTAGPHRGRFGWSGGLGTDFFVDPGGTIAILLTQVEMGERVGSLLQDFQELPSPSPS